MTHLVLLTGRELKVLKTVLAASGPLSGKGMAALRAKLDNPKPYPDITIGVFGGLVQWARGNPFPIHICDYDGDGRELPDLDKEGNRCSIWLEPADPRSEATHYR